MINEREIIEYIKNKIPIVLDLESGDLKLDARNIYCKIYRYIINLKEELKKYKGE